MVCAHIHPAYGRYRPALRILNASIVNEEYQAVNPLMEVGLTPVGEDLRGGLGTRDR
jgi:hypothetical protein